MNVVGPHLSSLKAPYTLRSAGCGLPEADGGQERLRQGLGHPSAEAVSLPCPRLPQSRALGV